MFIKSLIPGISKGGLYAGGREKPGRMQWHYNISGRNKARHNKSVLNSRKIID